ncbi:MAG: response regulator [Methanoregula sp.]
MESIPAVFIVEDEGIVSGDIRDILIGLGYTVAGIASSGETALEKIRDTQPDLILMDIHLAGKMDGIETAELIRRDYAIPVIFLTAYADKELLDRAKVTGPYGYIIKPFDERTLQSAIETAVYKHGMERQLRESEATTRLMVDATRDMLFLIRADGRFLVVNKALAEHAGASPDMLNGTSAYDLVAKGVLTPRMACWQLDARGEKRLSFEEQMTRGWFDVTICPVYNKSAIPEKFAVSIREITMRKLAEETMKNNAEYFRTMIEETAEVVVMLNPDGTFSRESPSFKKALGYGQEEPLKPSFFDHLNLADWQRAKQVFSEVLIHPGMAKPVQLKFEKADGSSCSIKGILNNLSDNPFIGKIVLNGWVT